MAQLHKKFSDSQVRAILRNDCQGQMSRSAAQELLGIGKSRFFVLLDKYRHHSEEELISYGRKSPGRISQAMRIGSNMSLSAKKRSWRISACPSAAITIQPSETG